MAYEQRDLSGSLFKNDKREKDSHPNLTGTLMVEGKEYWVSAWTKERNNGDKWLSLALKPKDANGIAPRSQPAPQQRASAFDDESDVPF
jgi:hypothetical protein